jgi:hypothetical protein
MAKPIPRDELINDYRRVARELDKRPTLAEYNEHGEYSQQPIYTQFDSFEDFKAQAGFETGEQKHSDQELLDDLRRIADERGRSPPVELYDEHGNHNSKTLKNRWGAWQDVLDAAGLEPTDHSQHWDEHESTEKTYGQSAQVVCENCGETKPVKPSRLEYKDRFFCDQDCMGEWMTEQTGEDARAWDGGKVTIVCETCGDMRDVKPAEEDSSRFCSQECMFEWRSELMSGESHPRWRGGYEPYYGPNWRPQRRKARDRDDYTCCLCGVGREEHRGQYGADHDVHHITPFREFDDCEAANRLENLITLCKQCHSKVEASTLEIPEGKKP